MTEETFHCPYCGYAMDRPEEGETARCPLCGANVRETTGNGTIMPPPPAIGPATGTPQTMEKAGQSVRMVGIFSIIVGSANVLAAILYGFFYVAILVSPQEALASATRQNPNVSLNTILLIYGVLALAALLGSIVPLVGGIMLLRRSKGALGWGYAGAIVSLVALWACCFWPFTVASGIYGLITLSKPEARQVLGQQE